MTDYISGYRPDSRGVPVLGQKWELDYLRPRKGSETALKRLHMAAQIVDTNCKDREDEFRSYDRPDIPTPTADQAEEMCAGCPLLKMCKTYAEVGHPAFGVYGGRVYGADLIWDEEEQ